MLGLYFADTYFYIKLVIILMLTYSEKLFNNLSEFNIVHNSQLLPFNFSDCRNYRELSEDWFDAKENLTGVDLSGIQENQIEKDKGDPKFPQGWLLIY